MKNRRQPLLAGQPRPLVRPEVFPIVVGQALGIAEAGILAQIKRTSSPTISSDQSGSIFRASSKLSAFGTDLAFVVVGRVEAAGFCGSIDGEFRAAQPSATANTAGITPVWTTNRIMIASSIGNATLRA